MKDDVSLVATGPLDNNQNSSLLAHNKFIKCCLFSILARCMYITRKLIKLYNIQSQMAPF